MSSHQPQAEFLELASAERAQDIRAYTLDQLTRYAQPGPDEMIELLRIRRGA
jgi:hypothetical protein